MTRGQRSKKRKTPAKKLAMSRGQQEKRALQSLGEKRRAFEPLLAQIVAAVLHAEGPRARADSVDGGPATGTRQPRWIEVGSGLGQLRSLLPAEVRDFVIHTELSEALVRGFRERHPDASVCAADVARLPFESESLDAVLGLCVFDSLPEPIQACKEVGRVLRSGGRFIHFLDAATNIEPILVGLVDAGRLPLPNFLADTALLEPALLDVEQLSQFLGPYHDLLSVPVEQFMRIAEMLMRAQHPMATMLQRYAGPFLRRPFDALAAARAFVALTSDIKTSRPMNQALTSLLSTLKQPPYAQQIPFELAPHSSLAHFQSRLEFYLGPGHGFTPRMSSVVYTRAFQADREQPLRANVRRVGIVRNSVDWPAAVGIPVQRLKADLPSSSPVDVSPVSHILREAAVYCFVAEKDGPA